MKIKIDDNKKKDNFNNINKEMFKLFNLFII